ncbi:hypothetical protein ACWGN5_13440 [Streptomyces sp. NPDC055815]
MTRAETQAVTSALDVETTARALERYRRKASVLTGAGAVLLVLALAVGELLGGTWAGQAATGLCLIGIPSLGAGIGSWFNAWRMRRALGSGTWSAHPAVAIGDGRTATTVVLRSPDRSEAWPLTVIATRQRYELVRPGPDGVLWWCGDPRAGGVLAPPGGGELIWAKRVRHAHVRRRVVARAEAEGLMHRASPRQPEWQGAALDRVLGLETVTRPGPVTVDGRDEDSRVDGPDEDSRVDGPPVRLDKAPPVPPAGPTYAELVEHARRQAGPKASRAPRREADVREVAWWRVRGLRRAAGLHRVLIALTFCTAVGAVALTGPPEEDLPKLYAVGALVVVALVYSVHRLLTFGRPSVRLLARAATAPVHILRRYVLLYDPQGGGPVLVLFPMYGGWSAGPEAVIPLIPPGPQKDLRRGLPSAPAGKVALHGWLDFTVDGRAYVVPWIEGRPLWPAGTYHEPDRQEFAVLLDRLAPPLEAQAS